MQGFSCAARSCGFEPLLHARAAALQAAHEHRCTNMLDLLSRALLAEFRESAPNLLPLLPQVRCVHKGHVWVLAGVVPC